MINGIPDFEDIEFEELECGVCFRVMEDEAQLARHICMGGVEEEDYQ
jgi:hypothetical protein